MDKKERDQILLNSKDFFRNKVALNHIQNTKKLYDLNQFNINPFTHKYLSNFAFGDSSATSMAKSILYPRIFGTSIATTFGTQLQHFCNDVLSSLASTTSGIDIEFIDALDGRKKYCQVKSGPTTINNDDVTTINNHFTAIKNLARTNGMVTFNPLFDCVVGVFYGSNEQLSNCYKSIAKNYPVFIGQEFWHRLTGDPEFYSDLINAFAEVAVEMDSSDLINSIVDSLAKQIQDAGY